MKHLHFIKTTFRSLRRYPLYTGLNIVGLGIGLAVCLAIVTYIRYETSYDSHYPDVDNTYRVLLEEEMASGTSINESLPDPVVPGLKESFAEIVDGVRVVNPGELLVRAEGEALFETTIFEADPTFFSVFPASVIQGRLEGALDDPGSMVITESTALKYFGRTNVVDLTMTTESSYHGESPYTIKAVIKDPPRNTHLHYEFVVPRSEEEERRWNYFMGQGYVMLNEQVSVETLEAKLKEWVAANAFYEYPRDEFPGLRLQPVRDIHLYPDWGTSSASLGPVLYLQMFGLAGLLVLLIAIINFVNLATARAAVRAKEMGIRKSVGAHRGQLIVHILGEALMLTCLAFGLALVATNFLFSVIGQQTGIDLSLPLDQPGWLIAFAAGVVLVTGLLSGLYPAWYLSAFQPVATLKGQWIRSASGTTLRKGLVVFQFVASIVLCIGTMAIYQQMEYIRSERLNSLDQQIVVIKDANRLEGVYPEFKSRVGRHGAVASVTTSSSIPGSLGSWAMFRNEDGTVRRAASLTVGEDYLETLGLNLISGVPFEETLALPETDETLFDADNEEGRGPASQIIVNEAFMTEFQLTDAEDTYVSRFHANVVGVLDDFHYLSLYEPIYPIRISYNPDRAFGHVMVRLHEGQIAEGLEVIRQEWEAFVPEHPLNFIFLDEELDAAYRSELQMFSIFGGFALLALVVACLGLFGLVTSMVETRTKEVGIRKVLGATVARIVWLLSGDFLKLVTIAFVVGAPVAYFLLQRWLEQFEYQLNPGFSLFALGGGIAALLAILTVGYQVTMAALSNPVNALRHE